jgi:hypothetical protein
MNLSFVAANCIISRYHHIILLLRNKKDTKGYRRFKKKKKNLCSLVVNSPIVAITSYSGEGDLLPHKAPKGIVESLPLLCPDSSSIMIPPVFCFIICAFKSREPGPDLSIHMPAVDAAGSIGSAHGRSARAAATSSASPHNY